MYSKTKSYRNLRVKYFKCNMSPPLDKRWNTYLNMMQNYIKTMNIQIFCCFFYKYMNI